MVVSRDDAQTLINTFESTGDFRPRKTVEADISRIQPLPVVVVRNRSGQILRLVRKEKDTTNKLHKKIALWAGGHVRQDDGPDRRNSIIAGAARELQEELKIQANQDRLSLLGAVYVPATGSTEKHMAIVYEWRADTDQVEVTLCNGEFMERQGTSLQGNFLAAEQIAADTDGLEDWSKEILNSFFLPQPVPA
jgi:predicted NUDIX family phosphoesterase